MYFNVSVGIAEVISSIGRSFTTQEQKKPCDNDSFWWVHDPNCIYHKSFEDTKNLMLAQHSEGGIKNNVVYRPNEGKYKYEVRKRLAAKKQRFR